MFEKGGDYVSAGANEGAVELSVGDAGSGHVITLTPDEARQVVGYIEGAIRDARTHQHEADAEAAHA